MRRIRRAAASAAAVWLSITTLAAPVSAHDDGGLFQPIVADFVIEGTATATGRTLWIRVIDADSGTPAEGIAADVSTAAGTSTLPEVGLGYYAGEVALTSGPASVTVALRSVPGGLVIRKFTKAWQIDVPPVGGRRVVAGAGRSTDLENARHGPAQAARLAAAKRGEALAVELEAVEDRTLASPLYVPLHVKVKVRATGALDSTEYEVYGWAVNDSGVSTEFVKLRPLDVTDPTYAAGTYGGVVILPQGGKWTMEADLLGLRKPTDPPIRVAGGTLTVERTGPALQRAGAAEDRLSAVKANLFNTTVLGLHSVAAAAWAVVLILLLLLSFQRARALSPWARNLLERNLDTIVRLAWVLTATVYITGIYNLYRESPYGVPSSWGELRQLLRLPFGTPYFLALGVKLAAYAVLLFASSRLISAARAKHRGPRLATRQTTRNPWLGAGNGGSGEPILEPAPVAAGPSLARGRTATSVVEAPPKVELTRAADDPGPTFRILIPVMATCGALIIVCVTILKAAHLLIEVARISS